MPLEPDREAMHRRAQEAIAAGDRRAAQSLLRYLLREDPGDTRAQAMLSELQSGGPASPVQPGAEAVRPAPAAGPSTEVVRPASAARPSADAVRPVSRAQPAAGAPRQEMQQAASIHCKKCGSQNPPALSGCRQCGADLLPGAGLGSRLGYLIGGILGALVCGYAGFFVIRSPESVPDIVLCNPILLGLCAVVLPFSGLWMALRKTPPYLRYAERADRHVKLNPSQALADLTQAVQLAPKTERVGLLSKRATLCEQLGLQEDAARDLLARASDPGAYQGEAAFFSVLLGADAKAHVEGRRKSEREALIASGRARVLGYCPRCKAVVELNPKLHCQVHPSRKARAVQWVVPADLEAGKQAVYRELEDERRAGRKKAISWAVALTILALAGLLLLGPNGFLKKGSHSTPPPQPTTAVAAAGVSRFAANVFSFDFPAAWATMTDRDVDTLLRTSLNGISDWEYIGGVYTGGMDDCRDCAQIVAVVLHDPSLTGTLTDEQYSQVKAAQEAQMGSRLLLHRRTQVGSFPATELVHVGKSNQTKLRELIIIPPEPGVAYLFSCSTDKDSYGDLEPVFARAIETLHISGSGPLPSPAATTASAPASGEPLRQWAVSAQASSQYGESSWAASQATGAPNTPQCGDETSAWAAATSDTVEWIQLDYGVPVQALQVNIIETYTPDQVVRVELLDTDGTYHPVYTGQPKTVTQCPYALSISVDSADYQVVAVKITIDQSASGQWNEIDAVELVGLP